MRETLKKIFRKIARPLYFVFYYLPQKSKVNKSRDSLPLLPGITAVVAVKNEEYTLPICLKSLIGVVDQIVIVDNGSQDSSLSISEQFKIEYGQFVQIDILNMPGALLGDCREAGLKATKHQWHLRWDADMVAHTDGPHSLIKLRDTILKTNKPRAIQIPRINLNGDFRHCTKGFCKDSGEPILVWFNKDIIYKEYEMFDTIKIPYYYGYEKLENYYCFHLQGLKSISNIMNRFHYFKWRKLMLNNKNEVSAIFHDYKKYVEHRNQLIFFTNDILPLKYRYQRLMVEYFEENKFKQISDYPKALKEFLDKNSPRFEVQYENNKAIMWIDKNDKELINYSPTKEDLEYTLEVHMKQIHSENLDWYK